MNEERYPVAQGVLQPIAGGIVGAVVLYVPGFGWAELIAWNTS